MGSVAGVWQFCLFCVILVWRGPVAGDDLMGCYRARAASCAWREALLLGNRDGLSQDRRHINLIPHPPTTQPTRPPTEHVKKYDSSGGDPEVEAKQILQQRLQAAKLIKSKMRGWREYYSLNNGAKKDMQRIYIKPFGEKGKGPSVGLETLPPFLKNVNTTVHTIVPQGTIKDNPVMLPIVSQDQQQIAPGHLPAVDQMPAVVTDLPMIHTAQMQQEIHNAEAHPHHISKEDARLSESHNRPLVEDRIDEQGLPLAGNVPAEEHLIHQGQHVNSNLDSGSPIAADFPAAGDPHVIPNPADDGRNKNLDDQQRPPVDEQGYAAVDRERPQNEVEGQKDTYIHQSSHQNNQQQQDQQAGPMGNEHAGPAEEAAMPPMRESDATHSDQGRAQEYAIPADRQEDHHQKPDQPGPDIPNNYPADPEVDQPPPPPHDHHPEEPMNDPAPDERLPSASMHQEDTRPDQDQPSAREGGGFPDEGPPVYPDYPQYDYPAYEQADEGRQIVDDYHQQRSPMEGENKNKLKMRPAVHRHKANNNKPPVWRRPVARKPDVTPPPRYPSLTAQKPLNDPYAASLTEPTHHLEDEQQQEQYHHQGHQDVPPTEDLAAQLITEDKGEHTPHFRLRPTSSPTTARNNPFKRQPEQELILNPKGSPIAFTSDPNKNEVKEATSQSMAAHVNTNNKHAKRMMQAGQRGSLSETTARTADQQQQLATTPQSQVQQLRAGVTDETRSATYSKQEKSALIRKNLFWRQQQKRLAGTKKPSAPRLMKKLRRTSLNKGTGLVKRILNPR